MIALAIEIKKFRKREKGAQVGFANIPMTTVSLEIRDTTVFHKNGER